MVEPARRSVLLAGLGGALVGALGGVAVPSGPQAQAPAGASAPGERVEAHGTWQAGIERPRGPQAHLLLLVLSGVDHVGGWLAELGERIALLTSERSTLPGGPGDLTVTVGIGPRLVSQVAPGGVGSQPLPAFRGDEALAPSRREGDVCLQLCASDPALLDLAAAELAALVPGETTYRRRGFRAAGGSEVVRTPLGFHDGVVVPRTPEELARHVFLTEGPLAGASVWVVRQLELDVAGFRALPLEEREAAVGRHESDGAPLGGSSMHDDVDLGAKRPDGEYVVPAAAHVRRAHPSFTGSGLMLRRSYSYEDEDGCGLLFISFQRELRTFVATQRRLDEGDAMLAFARPRASFTFLALPGFTPQRQLGHVLTTGVPAGTTVPDMTGGTP